MGREDASVTRTVVSQGSRSCFNFYNMEHAVLEKDEISFQFMRICYYLATPCSPMVREQQIRFNNRSH